MDIRVDLRTPTPKQCRAARAVLGWSLIEASRRMGLSIATISRSERDHHADQDERARMIVKASYENAGVNFLQLQAGRGLLWGTSDPRRPL
jgi:transcriptional regulator with XRE-family HTH domain